MPVSPGENIRLVDMQNLAALANSKTSLQTVSGTHFPYSFKDWIPMGNVKAPVTNPAWLTELNNLRSDISKLIYPDNLPYAVGDPRYAANGQFLPIGNFSPNYLNNTFYYEYKGTLATVNLSVGLQGGTLTKGTTVSGIGFNGDWAAVEGGFYIPGPNSVTIIADFYTIVNGQHGNDPTSDISVDTDLGIGTRSFVSFGTQTVVVWAINQIVPPGTYMAAVSSKDNSRTLVHQKGFSMDYLGKESDGGTNLGGPTCSTSYTGGAPVPGIDKSFPVYSFLVGSPNINPPIFYFLFSIPTQASIVAASNPPWPQAAYGPPYYQFPQFPNQLTVGTSVPGFWAANVTPITNMNFTQPSDMPWNLEVTAVIANQQEHFNPMLTGQAQPGGSLVDGKSIELQSYPPPWKANTSFASGFTIQDSNGNFQKSNGLTSGASIPAWSSSFGGITNDNGGSWLCVKVVASSVTPAVARPLSVPRYPAYWQSETNPVLAPPTSSGQGKTIFGWGSQWFSAFNNNGSLLSLGWSQGDPVHNNFPNGIASGWFIYGVSFNRVLGNAVQNVQLPPAAQVQVTIGCIRNGSFISFGTFNTGQTINVLWPIFTSDALVYQCSERIDVQAVAIKSPTTTGIMGQIVFNSPDEQTSFPMAAAYYNDTESILNLLT